MKCALNGGHRASALQPSISVRAFDEKRRRFYSRTLTRAFFDELQLVAVAFCLSGCTCGTAISAQFLAFLFHPHRHVLRDTLSFCVCFRPTALTRRRCSSALAWSEPVDRTFSASWQSIARSHSRLPRRRVRSTRAHPPGSFLERGAQRTWTRRRAAVGRSCISFWASCGLFQIDASFRPWRSARQDGGRDLSQSKMPPQQSDSLLNFFDIAFDFGAHGESRRAALI